MNCDQIHELLPWLLNGTLEGPELREVEAHLESCEACQAERAETRLAGRIFAAHVPAADLVAYAFAEPTGVGDVGRETIDRHLAVCPRCTEELELAAESRRLCAEDAEDDAGADTAEVVPFRRPERHSAAPPARASRWLALAAGLAALTATGGWMWSWQQAQSLAGRVAAERRSAETTSERLAEIERKAGELNAATTAAQEQIARLEAELAGARGAGGDRPAAPQLHLNTPVIDLFPGDLVVRGAGGGRPPAATRLPTDAGLVTLILNVVGRDEFADYELRILDAGGRETLRRRGLRRDADTGSFTVSLPGGLLGRGEASLEIYGLRGGQATKVADYPVQVGG